jgi:CheY-like chemotaxis protein
MEYKLLIVDDDEGSRILTKAYLEVYAKNTGLEFTIDMAEDGHEAINYVVKKDGKYDLVLLDVKMPGLSGIDVYQFLKQNFHHLTTKTLWITGFSLDLEEFLQANKLIHLTKPFDITTFHEYVDRFFNA